MLLLAEAAWFRGDVAEAERRWNEALEMSCRDDVTLGIVFAKRWLSFSACAKGHFDRAERLCEESLERMPDDAVDERALVTLSLARVELFRGDATQSVGLFRECLQVLRDVPDYWHELLRGMEYLSWALTALKRSRETAQLLGFLSAERDRTGMILPPVDRSHHEQALNSAREGLGDEEFSEVWEAGAALTLEEAVDFVLAISP
jgi:hypothetical protein